MKKNIGVLFILLTLAVCFTGCYQNRVPTSGVWYCEELEITLDFDSQNQAKTAMVVEGKALKCKCGNERNSNVIVVLHQDFNADIAGYNLGDVLFSGNSISLTENRMCLKTEEGIEYWFVRQR